MNSETQPPTITPEEYTSCSICLDVIDNLDSKTDLRCGHEFHARCIVSALRHDTRCPICRDPGFEDTNGDDDHINEIATHIREELALRSAAHQLRSSVENDMKSILDDSTINTYERLLTDLFQCRQSIETSKYQKFQEFKRRYYNEESLVHHAFSLKKQRLYNLLSRIKQRIDVDAVTWNCFCKILYQDIGKNKKLPIQIMF